MGITLNSPSLFSGFSLFNDLVYRLLSMYNSYIIVPLSFPLNLELESNNPGLDLGFLNSFMTLGSLFKHSKPQLS